MTAYFNPDMAPGKTISGMYYQMPGPVGHITALGIIERSHSVEAHAPGAHLLGIQTHPLDDTVAELGERGIEYIQDEIEEYAVGRNILTAKLNGVGFSIAEHKPGGHDMARSLMFTKDGITDFGDANQGGLLEKVAQINVAVWDIDQAITNFTRVFGTPVYTGRKIGLDVAYFRAPGNGFGLEHLVLIALPSGATASSATQRIEEFLMNFGEGICQVGYSITDLTRFENLLCSRGLNFVDQEKVVNSRSKRLCLPTLDNVDHYFIGAAQ